MTRANAEQIKFVPWFAKAGAACSIVPISRFVTDHIFVLKSGGYGCLFSLIGIDEEALTDLELESQLRLIEGALSGLPEGACLYQYTRVMSGFDLPRQHFYANPVTKTFVDDRIEFLEKTAAFRRIDLHWCLTFEPLRVKSFERKPQGNNAATLVSIMDESRVEMLGRQHGIRQKCDDGGVAKTLAAFLRRADEGTLSPVAGGVEHPACGLAWQFVHSPQGCSDRLQSGYRCHPRQDQAGVRREREGQESSTTRNQGSRIVVPPPRDSSTLSLRFLLPKNRAGRNRLVSPCTHIPRSTATRWIKILAEHSPRYLDNRWVP